MDKPVGANARVIELYKEILRMQHRRLFEREASESSDVTSELEILEENLVLELLDLSYHFDSIRNRIDLLLNSPPTEDFEDEIDSDGEGEEELDSKETLIMMDDRDEGCVLDGGEESGEENGEEGEEDGEDGEEDGEDEEQLGSNEILITLDEQDEGYRSDGGEEYEEEEENEDDNDYI